MTWTIGQRASRSASGPFQRGGSSSARWICISARPYRKRAAASATAGRHVGVAEERPVELGRRDVGDDRAGRSDDLAVGEPDAGGPPVRDQDPSHVGLEADLAARVRDDSRERVDEANAAPDGHRHAAELERRADHLGHEAGGRLIRAEARVEHPGREHAAGRLRGECRGRPSRDS